MDLYAVFGNPIAFSKSPIIFKDLFREFKIKANYIRVSVNNAEDIPQVIKKLNIKGANITTPFKEKILDFIDEISPEAKKIGAVNTIKVIDNKLVGYNTDYFSINNFTNSIDNKKALIVGSGGAAAAAVYALKSKGFEITILNRTIKKAETLAAKFNCKSDDLKNIENYKKKSNIIVNAISDGKIKIIDESFFCKNQIFIDANYKTSSYKIFEKNKDVKYFSGEQWLVNQANATFEIFFDYKKQIIDNFNIPEKKYDLIEIFDENDSLLKDKRILSIKNIVNSVYKIKISSILNVEKINIQNIDLLYVYSKNTKRSYSKLFDEELKYINSF